MIANRPNPSSRSNTLLSVIVVIAVLYFARDVFIPLALAVLFAFLLGPLVMRLRHWGLWRMPAVLIVVTLAFIAIAGVADLMCWCNSRNWAARCRNTSRTCTRRRNPSATPASGFIGHFSRAMHDFSKELSPASSSTNQPIAERAQKPVPVEIQHSAGTPMEFVPRILGSVVGSVIDCDNRHCIRDFHAYTTGGFA